MAKEIYISSTPHETRLAIVENDALAEIYYERENEYTLAGSIYNGRVTRFFTSQTLWRRPGIRPTSRARDLSAEAVSSAKNASPRRSKARSREIGDETATVDVAITIARPPAPSMLHPKLPRLEPMRRFPAESLRARTCR
jgi:hypothetical protein